MKRYTILLLALVLFALPARAQKLEVHVNSAIVYQALEHDNDNNSLSKIASGFQNAVGNLGLTGEIFPGGNVNVDIYISSKHHNETYGYQGYFQMTQLPAWMKLGRINEFYSDHVEVKAGQMTLGFGDGHLYRSINGDVYNNELVGNPVSVAGLTALGTEATFKTGPVRLMAGFSNGTTAGTIAEGKGIALHGKATVAPFDEKVRVSLSGYRVNHSANGIGYPGTGTKSYLFAGGDREGSRYDVWSGDDGGQIFFGKEQDVAAIQLDARVNPVKPLLVYGSATYYKDADCNGMIEGNDNGNPVDRWNAYMVTAKYSLTDWLYVAGRYSTAIASQLIGAELNGQVNRVQVGGGFKLYEGVLLKVEYVNQTTSGFSVGQKNGGADLGLNPTFSGISVETAVRF